jgi:uronate dehydrogenase
MEPTTDTRAKRRVLITGAAGRIGSRFAEYAKDRYALRLMVHPKERPADALRGAGELVTGDLCDPREMHRVCQGVDTVLHLAANPDPAATWEALLPTNIGGTYHTFVAAKAAGCRRIVLASSIHAVAGHLRQRQVRPDDPVNPGNLYGVSKCFGEALGRYLAEQEGLSCLAVRIGTYVTPAEAQQVRDPALFGTFVSDRDLCDLLVRCIDAEGVGFAIVHGLSSNLCNALDLTETTALLGYRPQDSFVSLNLRLADEAPREG